MSSATEHRCKAGGWKPGPVKQCKTCTPEPVYRPDQYIRVITGRL